LRRVAEALDCTLVYALVPTTLETMVRERARGFARRRREAIEHSMLLEDQQVITKEVDARLDELCARRTRAFSGLAVSDLFDQPAMRYSADARGNARSDSGAYRLPPRAE